eukprot:2368274-Pleurochrysis_carterae.AAC.2
MQPPSLSASVGCTSFTSSTADFAAFLPPGPNTPDGVEAAANSAAPQGDGSASRSSHGGSCGGAGINAQRRTPTPPVFDAAGAAKGREVLREDGIVVRIVPSAATGDDTASATLCAASALLRTCSPSLASHLQPTLRNAAEGQAERLSHDLTHGMLFLS